MGLREWPSLTALNLGARQTLELERLLVGLMLAARKRSWRPLARPNAGLLR